MISSLCFRRISFFPSPGDKMKYDYWIIISFIMTFELLPFIPSSSCSTAASHIIIQTRSETKQGQFLPFSLQQNTWKSSKLEIMIYLLNSQSAKKSQSVVVIIIVIIIIKRINICHHQDIGVHPHYHHQLCYHRPGRL